MGKHALSIAFGVIFLLALVGQSIAGYQVFLEEQSSHGGDPAPYLEFITSSQFLVDVSENWQSEYLQFFLYIFATIWLVQQGSPESKKPGEEGLGTDEEQMVHEHAVATSPAWAKIRGWKHTLFSNSLLLVMGAIFLLSWLAQSLAGVVVFNEEQLAHGEDPVTWLQYLASADFWNRTLQNWQSEFLAVGSMVVLSIYLRQRGSPESKPVGAPHGESAVSG